MSIPIKPYAVEPGDILRMREVWFKVTETREPRHPAYPGRVFVGHFYDWRRRVWGPETVLNVLHEENFRLEQADIFPVRYLTAYLSAGEPAIVENFSNGCWAWSSEVKCKVMDFGERTSLVKITGKATQFVTGAVYEVPTQRLYRREDKK